LGCFARGIASSELLLVRFFPLLHGSHGTTNFRKVKDLTGKVNASEPGRTDCLRARDVTEKAFDPQIGSARVVDQAVVMTFRLCQKLCVRLCIVPGFSRFPALSLHGRTSSN
jgi:hypothetical protein